MVRGGIGLVQVLANFITVAHTADHSHQALWNTLEDHSHLIWNRHQRLTSNHFIGTGLLGQSRSRYMLVCLFGY